MIDQENETQFLAWANTIEGAWAKENGGPVQGICPECGAPDLSYSEREDLEDGLFRIPYLCGSCGSTGFHYGEETFLKFEVNQRTTALSGNDKEQKTS